MNSGQNAGASGQVTATNCGDALSGDSGCSMKNPSTSSFGTGFNNQGGGIYAMEWTATTIKMWTFTHANAPASLTSGSPVISQFGTPYAAFATGSGCTLASKMGPQQIVRGAPFRILFKHN
jgi:hypothetical protein